MKTKLKSLTKLNKLLTQIVQADTDLGNDLMSVEMIDAKKHVFGSMDNGADFEAGFEWAMQLAKQNKQAYLISTETPRRVALYMSGNIEQIEAKLKSALKKLEIEIKEIEADEE
jgi:hypothetical protein